MTCSHIIRPLQNQKWFLAFKDITPNFLNISYSCCSGYKKPLQLTMHIYYKLLLTHPLSWQTTVFWFFSLHQMQWLKVNSRKYYSKSGGELATQDEFLQERERLLPVDQRKQQDLVTLIVTSLIQGFCWFFNSKKHKLDPSAVLSTQTIFVLEENTCSEIRIEVLLVYDLYYIPIKDNLLRNYNYRLPITGVHRC